MQSSGLGKLMSALHQNAASLVNTKAEHNGPDQVSPDWWRGAVLSCDWLQVLAAAEVMTSVRNHPVVLRREEAGLGAEEPLSVPSLLHQVDI